jgi:imidazolonepropionase-like amidohydrolase
MVVFGAIAFARPRRNTDGGMAAVRTVLRNAAVLDPGAGSLAEGQAVVVEDDRVVEVGPAGAVRAGEAAALDVRGMTVMPG